MYTIFLGKQGKRVYTIDPERGVYTIEPQTRKKKKRMGLHGGGVYFFCVRPICRLHFGPKNQNFPSLIVKNGPQKKGLDQVSRQQTGLKALFSSLFRGDFGCGFAGALRFQTDAGN